MSHKNYLKKLLKDLLLNQTITIPILKMTLIEVIAYVSFPAFSLPLFANCALISSNDRLGRKVHVKCDTESTIGDSKKLIAEAAESKPDPAKVHSSHYDKGGKNTDV